MRLLWQRFYARRHDKTPANLPGAGKVVAYAPLERQQTIDTPVEGRVLRWHVIEGTQVKAGDLVAEVLAVFDMPVT